METKALRKYFLSGSLGLCIFGIAATVIAAGWSGKVKTASTMVGLCVMMALPGVQMINTIVMGLIVVVGTNKFVEKLDVQGIF